jgi:hypothetical protein
LYALPPEKLHRIKHQSSPLSLEGIPPFKGGLTPKAAFGRQFSILAHWFADFRKVLK